MVKTQLVGMGGGSAQGSSSNVRTECRVLGQVLESQEQVLECSNTSRNPVLEYSANTLVLDWNPGLGVDTGGFV